MTVWVIENVRREVWDEFVDSSEYEMLVGTYEHPIWLDDCIVVRVD